MKALLFQSCQFSSGIIFFYLSILSHTLCRIFYKGWRVVYYLDQPWLDKRRTILERKAFCKNSCHEQQLHYGNYSDNEVAMLKCPSAAGSDEVNICLSLLLPAAIQAGPNPYEFTLFCQSMHVTDYHHEHSTDIKPLGSKYKWLWRRSLIIDICPWKGR